jgi:hypothetical protein
MDNTKYGKYFIYSFGELKNKNAWAKSVTQEQETKLLRIDRDVIEGITFFSWCNWFWPEMLKAKLENRSTKPHSHTYDEVIGMVGTNPNDPHDLCGEIEINLGGEKHIVTKSCLIYIPARLEHGPFRELKMERPIVQFEFGLNPIHD